MPANITSAEILAQFRPVAEEHFASCASRWRQQHQQELSAFRASLQTCLTALEGCSQPNDVLRPLWQELERHFSVLEQWASALPYITEDTALQDIRGSWTDAYAGFTEPLPEEAQIPMEASYWDPHSEDTVRMEAWKFGQRLKRRIQNARYRMGNGIRRKLGKPLRSPDDQFRTFPIEPFVGYYLEQPYTEFLLQEWENHLHQVVQDLGEIHQIVTEMSIVFLFLEDAEHVWVERDSQAIAAQLASSKEWIDRVDALAQQQDTHQTEAMERFRGWYEEIADTIRRTWHVAGTYMLPVATFGEANAERRQEKFSRDFERHKNAWSSHLSMEQQDFRHDISLTIIQLTAGIAYFDTARSLSEKISGRVVPEFSRALGPLSESLERFRNIDKEDTSALSEAIASERQTLTRTLRERFLPQIMDTLIQTQLDADLQRFLEQTRAPIQVLPDSQTIFRTRDTERIPPRSESTDIPIRELVEDTLLATLRTKLSASQKAVREKVEEILHGISEIDQVVEFNLDAALALLQEQKPLSEVHQTVLEGLGRARGRIDQFIQQCNGIEQQIRNDLLGLSHTFVEDVQELLDNEKAIAFKLQVARTKAQERFRSYRRRTWRFLRGALPRLWSYVVSGLSHVYRQYMRFGRMAGLVVAPVSTQEQILQFLSETNRRIAELPYVYQRLFRTEPLTDERFFAGRDEEMAILKADCDLWLQGRYMTTAVVGERGSGRTTLLNFAEEQVFSRFPIKKIDIAETIWGVEDLAPYLEEAFGIEGGNSLPEITRVLQDLDEPVICIVENIQNMFLKTVDGFDLLEAFLLLISQTYRNVYWVVTCTLYSWEYLDKVIRISQHFQRVLTLGGLTRESTESIILKRHRVTGYQLLFEIPERIRKTRKYRRLSSEEDQQKHLENLFFERLESFGSGNVLVTMLFWLIAIQQIEQNRLILSPEISIDYSFLHHLSPEELFTLGTVLQHEVLKAEEYAEVFHQDLQQSVLLMNTLYNKGMLIESPVGYMIHPFLYRPIVRLLKVRNIVH